MSDVKMFGVEVVEIDYDPNVVSYETLINLFFRSIDPLDAGGQFCDRGRQYSSAIFPSNDGERKIAERIKAEINASGVLPGDIVTPILPATPFYAADDYHQDYYKKNPIRYKYYRGGSGRDDFIEENWKDVNLK